MILLVRAARAWDPVAGRIPGPVVLRCDAAGGTILDVSSTAEHLPGRLPTLAAHGHGPQGVLDAARAVPAAACGLGRRKGRLARGYDADVLLVDADPLEDITALLRPLAVVRAGRVVALSPCFSAPASTTSRMAARAAADAGARAPEVGDQMSSTAWWEARRPAYGRASPARSLATSTVQSPSQGASTG